MKKTAAFILNHNLPEETNKLYELLKPYEREDYKLMVLENGSAPEKTSKYAEYKTDQNIYFGGGYNALMTFCLENDEFDSLMVISNDIMLYPQEFIRTLRAEMFSAENQIRYDIVSPCVYNLFTSMHWPTMFNWGSSKIREVPFIDFQCALVSKRLLAEAKKLDVDLMYGWGIDIWFSILAKKNTWKMGVLDRVFVVHDDSLTTRKGVVDNLTTHQYWEKAKVGEERFFRKLNLQKEYNFTRDSAKKYTYDSQDDADYFLFNMHIMWYESGMINETLDSISNALVASNANVKFKFCLNSQTYIETPVSGSAADMFDQFKNHPLMRKAEVVYKTDTDEFYNIGDWRRDVYDPKAKYTIWGESDCLLPTTFFVALQNFKREEKHVVSFSSRKLWSDEWKLNEHDDIRKYSYSDNTVNLLNKKLLTWEVIDQNTLNDFNKMFFQVDGNFHVEERTAPPREGSLVCISKGFDENFIAKDLHFAREDTCFEKYCEVRKIPNFLFSKILKGHNYSHPLKRTNTNNTREEEAYKKYERQSLEAIDRFVNELNNK